MSERGPTSDRDPAVSHDPGIDARLARLEESLAHQEKISHDLSEVIARQSAEIDHLTQQVAALIARERSRDSNATGEIFFGDEKPPHW